VILPGTWHQKALVDALIFLHEETKREKAASKKKGTENVKSV
jgi:hypothetical protein